MMGTPFVYATSVTSGAQAIRTSAQTIAAMKQIDAQRQALNDQEVTASVDQNYKNLKAKGAIPVISGPCKMSYNSINNTYTLSSNMAAMDAPIYPPLMEYCHDQGEDYWGAVPLLFEQKFDNAANCYRQKDCAAGLGYGGENAWCWMGLTFQYGGPSGNHNIIIHEYERGCTDVTVAGYASSIVEVVIQDNTNGAKDSRTEYNFGAGAPFQYDFDDQQVNQMMPEILTNGHTYTVYVKLKASSQLWGTGAANSDYDWNDGGIWLKNVEIN